MHGDRTATSKSATQVLIVGAGPVGLTLAMDLAQRGRSVVDARDPRAAASRRTSSATTSRRARWRSSAASAWRRRARRRPAAGLPERRRLPHHRHRRGAVAHPHSRPARPLHATRAAPTPGGRRPSRRTASTRSTSSRSCSSTPRRRRGVTILNRSRGDRLRAGRARRDRAARDLDGGATIDGARALPGRLRRRPLGGAQGDRRGLRRHAGDPARAVDLHPRARACSTLIRGKRGLELLRVQPAPLRQLFAIDGRETWLVHNYLHAERGPSSTRSTAMGRSAPSSASAPTSVRGISKEDWIGRRLVADRFRDRRVFICGDAAHLWVPYAGYGMNAGIADAMNLSWLLAARLRAGPTSDPGRLRGRAPADHRAGLALRDGPRAADDQGARRGAGRIEAAGRRRRRVRAEFGAREPTS